jgi:hypothetical protein
LNESSGFIAPIVPKGAFIMPCLNNYFYAAVYHTLKEKDLFYCIFLYNYYFSI